MTNPFIDVQRRVIQQCDTDRMTNPFIDVQRRVIQQCDTDRMTNPFIDVQRRVIQQCGTDRVTNPFIDVQRRVIQQCDTDRVTNPFIDVQRRVIQQCVTDRVTNPFIDVQRRVIQQCGTDRVTNPFIDVQRRVIQQCDTNRRTNPFTDVQRRVIQQCDTNRRTNPFIDVQRRVIQQCDTDRMTNPFIDVQRRVIQQCGTDRMTNPFIDVQRRVIQQCGTHPNYDSTECSLEMSIKSFQLIDTFDEQVPTSSQIGEHGPEVDWSKCIFCQTDSGETLQCPASAKQSDTSAGYKHYPKTLNNLMRLTAYQLGLKDYVCFFCNTIEEDERLREATTYAIDNRVRECAQKLQDTALLAKLSAGDLVAQEAKYHAKCLLDLYRKASRVANDDESEGGTQTRIRHGIALAELASFIEESRSEDNVAPVFNMSDLSKMYGNRLEKMEAEQESRVHSTRSKNRLLTYITDIEAYKQGLENLLDFKDDIGPALRRAYEEDYDSNYMQIYKAVKIVRSDMMATSSEFNGTFAANCQEKSVPRSLLTLVNMLQYGPDITTDSFSQETLSIAQMLIFNSHKRIQKSNRHAKSRETPSHMYLGIVIHCQTRKRELIDKMYKVGLSVSYDRILSVSASLTNTLCKQYQEDGYVCPPSLRIGLFTTAAVDNIDHNPSSTTAKDSFHGTGISLFQHVTSQMNGQQRIDFQLTDIQGGRVTESLPDSYAVVKPAVLKTNVPIIPVTDSACKGCTDDLQEAVQNEYRWLETVAN
ncbi:unnamed protein product [Mytilus coruscus]|uniref:Uncharacterized protein n=1 Tax=Mytilus coruscus TaxID=42192 RepID=A0A6J8CXI5_MYTCO|nr:unnamed protein product [Mytilus coruscus]